jgi:AcrR family transcriptional regulator
MIAPPVPKPGLPKNILRFEAPATPRKRPRQSRSIALVDALKKAGRDILEREGREALTVYRLSEDAGVAVSSIYEYFPTIESLIAAIFDQYRLERRQRLLEQIAALPPTARLFDGLLLVLRTGLALLHSFSQLDPAFNVKAIQYDELVRLDLIRPDNFWSACATPALLTRFAGELLVQDQEKAHFLVYQTLMALPRAIVLEKPEYLSEPDTALLLAGMLNTMLTGRVHCAQ